MTDLPRFSRGQIGRLHFSDLNNAFDLLEQLAPLRQQDLTQAAASRDQLLVARIVAIDLYGGHEWKEVVVEPTNFPRAQLTWIDREGGRESGSRFNQDWEPAFAAAPFGSGLGGQVAQRIAPDTIVVLRRMQRMDGKVFWLSMSGGASSRWPAMITASYPLQAAGGITFRWRYEWREAELVAPSGGGSTQWAIKQNGLYGQLGQDAGLGAAFNGAEQDGIVGAGGTAGQGVTERNAPIANGIVVPMSMQGVYPWFSLGNTITVECGVVP